MREKKITINQKDIVDYIIGNSLVDKNFTRKDCLDIINAFYDGFEYMLLNNKDNIKINFGKLFYISPSFKEISNNSGFVIKNNLPIVKKLNYKLRFKTMSRLKEIKEIKERGQKDGVEY